MLRPTLTAIGAAAALFAADQAAYQLVGSHPLGLQALLDWTAHLLTTLFIVWALGSAFRRAQLMPALVASVVIDADHLPGHFGSDILTAGTHRPYTHSLLSVLVLGTLACGWPRLRNEASGAALGVASHLWRDLAEPHGAGVALLWPASDASVTVPGAIYLASIAGLVIIDLLGLRARTWAARDRSSLTKRLRAADVTPGTAGGGSEEI